MFFKHLSENRLTFAFFKVFWAFPNVGIYKPKKEKNNIFGRFLMDLR